MKRKISVLMALMLAAVSTVLISCDKQNVEIKDANGTITEKVNNDIHLRSENSDFLDYSFDSSGSQVLEDLKNNGYKCSTDSDIIYTLKSPDKTYKGKEFTLSLGFDSNDKINVVGFDITIDDFKEFEDFIADIPGEFNIKNDPEINYGSNDNLSFDDFIEQCDERNYIENDEWLIYSWQDYPEDKIYVNFSDSILSIEFYFLDDDVTYETDSVQQISETDFLDYYWTDDFYYIKSDMESKGYTSAYNDYEGCYIFNSVMAGLMISDHYYNVYIYQRDDLSVSCVEIRLKNSDDNVFPENSINHSAFDSAYDMLRTLYGQQPVVFMFM